jgi:hypothetical protein
MNHTLLLLAACTLWTQDPQEPEPWKPPQQVPEAPAPVDENAIEWVDSTSAVVHDMILTRSDMASIVAQVRKANPDAARDPKALDKLTMKLLNDRVDELLQIQACRDAGFDPQRIDDLVRLRMEDIVRSHGGPAKTAEYLAELDRTPTDLHDQVYERLLATTWREMVTGEAPGITGRVQRDRFVRPGQLHAVYLIERERGDPRWIEVLGGEAERVSLQSLVLPVDAQGKDAAVAQATEIREEALDGADFGQLVRTWSVVPANDGISRPNAVQDLVRLSQSRHGNDELGVFVREAPVGAISAPMPSSPEASDRPMVFLYRLVERLPARLPEFETERTQTSLRKEVQRLNDERRLATAMRLIRAALLERMRGPATEGEKPEE